MSNHLQEPVLTKEEQEADEKMASLQAESIVRGMAFPMVFKAALELGVIDAIVAAGNGVWLSPSEIVASLPSKPMNPEAPVLLDRMLRLLVTHSILKCRMIENKENCSKGDAVYAAEPVCKFFLNNSDGSGSFLPSFLMTHSEVHFKTWSNLKNVISEGKDACSSAHNMKLFEYLGSDEKFAELFNQAMSESSTMVMNKVLEVYKGFKDVNTLVDVGGGIGKALSLIVSTHPHIKGVNFDLAQVVNHAPSYPGVHQHVSGDMFIEIPKGDVIFLKRVLHDWTDEHCIKILKNCWKSLPEKGKIIIVDRVAPAEPKRGDFTCDVVYSLDLLMLLQCSGGKERSLSQFENLAFHTGFLRCEIVCQAFSFSVIELHK